MNIAIIGSHGVGKTELFDDVVAELGLDFVHIEDIGLNDVEKSKGFFDYMHAQEQIIAERICDVNWDRNHNGDSIIIDGSIISDLAYMILGDHSYYDLAFPGNIKNNIDVLKNISPVIMEAIDHFHVHDLLFYIPIEYDYGEQSLEEMPTKEFNHQREIDIIIRRLLENYNIAHRTITGSLEERKETVLDTIKTIGK